MLSEISDFVGMEVYTDKGIALGNIDDLIIETDKQKIEGLYIGNPNPLLVEHSRAVSVPYRWIHSVGDVIILKYFPKFVTTEPTPERVSAMSKMKGGVKHMGEVVHHAEEKIIHAEHQAVDKIKAAEKKLEGEIKKF